MCVHWRSSDPRIFAIKYRNASTSFCEYILVLGKEEWANCWSLMKINCVLKFAICKWQKKSKSPKCVRPLFIRIATIDEHIAFVELILIHWPEQISKSLRVNASVGGRLIHCLIFVHRAEQQGKSSHVNFITGRLNRRQRISKILVQIWRVKCHEKEICTYFSVDCFVFGSEKCEPIVNLISSTLKWTNFGFFCGLKIKLILISIS